MEDPLMTYALWGRGELTPANATAILEEYVPDNVGTVYRPVEVPRTHVGLRNALDWFESPDFLGDGGAVPSTDLIQSLLDDQENNGDDVFLLALWPGDPTHEEFDFIEAVHAAGIYVYDLSRGMDELDLSLYSRPAPTAEERAEARAAAKEAKNGSRRGRKLSDDTPAQEAPAVKAEETPEVVEENDIVAYVPGPVEAVENLVSATFLADNMFVAIKAYIDDQIERAVAARLTGPAPVEERPPFDPPYVGVDTKPYYMQKSTGKFRAADGKPRRGEEVHNLTDEEARQKGLL